MAKNKTGSVYALIDPRDDRVRYIGKTTQALLDRLGGHLATPTNPAMRVWINALGSQGLVPRIELVATAPEAHLDAEEKRQIQRHAEAGHRLLNSPYYHRNLADIFAPVTNAATPAARKQADARGDAFAHRLYGPIAAARAAGQMSRWRAAVRIAVRAPVVGLANLWCVACGMPGFRPAVRVGVFGTYFWMIGFDRLAKDEVISRLPVAEITHFWNEYLATPLCTLGWQILAVSLLAGWVSYVPVAEAAGVPSFGEPNPQSLRIDLRGITSTPLPVGLDAVDVAAAAAAALDAVVLPDQPPRRH